MQNRSDGLTDERKNTVMALRERWLEACTNTKQNTCT
ncbi:MAG: hypothetical protein Nkreftii_002360 [Candidatus Nitrospira kreftii]|uniref:Uncharacterized protein n=1 Tax=Candidatus Nitrospira kreftii TaxID=2652173 RepID=A0A7S8FF02_9BACT|nr:MAG: hypothetical protein Nkreftii_002360 [Candidatus Nitrospira kreftii]